MNLTWEHGHERRRKQDSHDLAEECLRRAPRTAGAAGPARYIARGSRSRHRHAAAKPVTGWPGDEPGHYRGCFGRAKVGKRNHGQIWHQAE